MRQLLYRISRKFYSQCRLETLNDPNQNGEYWLLDVLAAAVSEQPTLVDIGANLGEWSKRAAEHFRRKFPQTKIHCFEPCQSTREMLAVELDSLQEVTIHSEGVAGAAGTAKFYSNNNGSGTNSLAPSSGTREEIVQLTTLDLFAVSLPETEPLIVKVDVEGFDCLVIEGGLQSLRKGRVLLLQFEYNWRWLQNRRSLYDVFGLIKGLPYSLYKLTSKRAIRFDEWHFELDRFFEGNYLLVHHQLDLLRWTSKGHFTQHNSLHLE